MDDTFTEDNKCFVDLSSVMVTSGTPVCSSPVAHLVLARVLFVTQFKSDPSDFCCQSRSACSYFRNAPVKKSNFVLKKSNEEDTNSAKQTV